MNPEESDLIVDYVYQGGRKGNSSDCPLHPLVGVSNSGGFRYLGDRTDISKMNLIVLKSNFDDPDWPDHLDYETGVFTYFGDNKKPGKSLLDTPRGGNLILTNLFAGRHNLSVVEHFPVILLFGGMGAGSYRDVRFLGLAVPGIEALGTDDDLVAIWRSSGPKCERFQNYRAQFTVLDIDTVHRNWINDVQRGITASSEHAPRVWLDWLQFRKYRPLTAPRSIETRTREEQLPRDSEAMQILESVYSRFIETPYRFEACALEIARLMMPDIADANLTRPWRDGGRDALGEYQIGTGPSSIQVDFALEAKCYHPAGKGVGVKELSRLISRLRHRQFGVLVTTSYLASQAYSELKDDDHPVIVISGTDIVNLLKNKVGNTIQIQRWLDSFT